MSNYTNHTQIRDGKAIFIVNKETGEIVSKVVDTGFKDKQLPDLFTSKALYVGIDIPYPAAVLTKELFLKSVKQIDGMVRNKTMIDFELIKDYVKIGTWNMTDIKIVDALISRLVAHNRVYTTRAEISAITGIAPNNISRFLTNNKHSLKILSAKPVLILEIHPAIAFKGSAMWRDRKIDKWSVE